MTTYPGAIDEFRNTTNLPGIVYDKDDTTTVFAEDTNNHSAAIVALETTLGVNPQGDYPTVADRLAAGGGGAGAWVLEFEKVLTTPDIEIVCSSLDLVTDAVYEVFFGAFCAEEITRLEFSGSSAISWGGQGWSNTGGSLNAIYSIPYISHPSIGPGGGRMTLTSSQNGSMQIDIGTNIGNQRSYHVIGADINYYSGGVNLEQIKLRTNTDYNLKAGSYLRIFKRAS